MTARQDIHRDIDGPSSLSATLAGARPFRLPPTEDRGAGNAQNSATHSGPSRLRLLVVEDEAVISMHLCAILDALGHEVCGPVATGEAAIAAAGTHRPDLVMMDVRLAGSMDGALAAARIHELFGIPSVLTTAFTADQIPGLPGNCGVLHLLPKPYTDRQVAALLGRLALPETPTASLAGLAG